MAAKVENTFPETVTKFGALGILSVGLYAFAEAAFSPAIAAALAMGGIYFGLFGAAIWGLRQLPKLFPKKEKA
jgi:hypothetical protein